MKGLPLHHSQKLLKETREETRFSYELTPTHDFKMEILLYGNQVKVIKPGSLKREIKTCNRHLPAITDPE